MVRDFIFATTSNPDSLGSLPAAWNSTISLAAIGSEAAGHARNRGHIIGTAIPPDCQSGDQLLKPCCHTGLSEAKNSLHKFRYIFAADPSPQQQFVGDHRKECSSLAGSALYTIDKGSYQSYW